MAFKWPFVSRVHLEAQMAAANALEQDLRQALNKSRQLNSGNYREIRTLKEEISLKRHVAEEGRKAIAILADIGNLPVALKPNGKPKNYPRLRAKQWKNIEDFLSPKD